MQKVETTWRKDGEWKARYSKLYSSQRLSISKEEEPIRISFMSNDSTLLTAPLARMQGNRRDSTCSSVADAPRYLTSSLSQRSDLYKSVSGSQNAEPDDLGGHERVLLDMVRARYEDLRNEARTLSLPKEDVSDDQISEPCVHGYPFRMTDRSVSRSRVSKISTRRDMDIASILAFTTTAAPAPAPLGIPAFQNTNIAQREENPRWSIRRSVCPVCSQKWRDRSSINNVKYSGLKRNSSSELPSVIAPARLRAAITLGYCPRPAPIAVDKDVGIKHGGFRNSNTSWQLTRARRFRVPKPQMPPTEDIAPPFSLAPMAQKDLDTRVVRFIKDKYYKSSA